MTTLKWKKKNTKQTNKNQYTRYRLESTSIIFISTFQKPTKRIQTSSTYLNCYTTYFYYRITPNTTNDDTKRECKKIRSEYYRNVCNTNILYHNRISEVKQMLVNSTVITFPSHWLVWIQWAKLFCDLLWISTIPVSDIVSLMSYIYNIYMLPANYIIGLFCFFFDFFVR